MIVLDYAYFLLLLHNAMYCLLLLDFFTIYTSYSRAFKKQFPISLMYHVCHSIRFMPIIFSRALFFTFYMFISKSSNFVPFCSRSFIRVPWNYILTFRSANFFYLTMKKKLY